MSDPDYERAIATWLNRTAAVTRELGDEYVELAEHLIPGGSGSGGGGRGRSVHAAAPIRIEVVSLRDDIAALAGRYHGLVRGTLRMGQVADSGQPVARLRFIAGALERLHGADPDLCEELAAAVWDLHKQAAGIIDPVRGTIRRPFRIDDPCPDCGLLSLWVDPRRWCIGCGVPSCGGLWGVAQPVLRSFG